MVKTLKTIRKSYTFRLRKTPLTFLEGFSAILDIDGELIVKYNVDDTEQEADFYSLLSDWMAVGSDMYFALNQHETGSK